MTSQAMVIAADSRTAAPFKPGASSAAVPGERSNPGVWPYRNNLFGSLVHIKPRHKPRLRGALWRSGVSFELEIEQRVGQAAMSRSAARRRTPRLPASVSPPKPSRMRKASRARPSRERTVPIGTRRIFAASS